MEKRIAAFFDIDGTIYREGLITELFKKFITHEIVPEAKWTDEVKPAYMKWDRRQGDYDDYLTKMVEIFKESTIGMSSEHVKHIAKKVIEQKGDRVYLFSRNQIEYHKSMGHLVIAISGSPYELVDEMAKKYEFDDFRGTVYLTDDKGIYTGEIIPMWDGKSKEKMLFHLAEKYNIDLENSYSYGDTMGDLLMFKNTGYPTAINPTKELIQNIQKDESLLNKIKVVVERKDVIYNIDLKNTNIINK